MATTTANYGLATGAATDDIVEASHHNRVADTVDRALGEVLRAIINRGVQDGWEIGADKQVGPGAGLVGACWCRTLSGQAIQGLTVGAVNHIYAVQDETSAPSGTLRFVGQLAPPGPGGAPLLGTLTLDAAGAVLGFDNNVAGVERHCHALRFSKLSGTGSAVAVPGGAVRALTVDHSVAGEFRIPGALRVEASGGAFELKVTEHHRGDRFEVEARNTGTAPADLAYSWSREGVLE